MIFLIYCLIAFFVVFFSVKCAYYLDLIEAKTNLSGLFLSGIILAGITSLPELVTSVSAISFLENPGLVIGNVLGSNIFNLTVLAVLVLLFLKTFLKNKVSDRYKKTLYLLIAIYSLVLLKMNFNFNIEIFNIDIISIIILISYFFSLKLMTGSEADDLENLENNNSENKIQTDKTSYEQDIKPILIKFIFFSMGLVISSVAITIATDKISEVTNIGSTMAGAILLGIATSIPEVATCLTLCRLGNFNGVFGNMIGSNMFNFIIITIGDVLYRKGTIYLIDNQSYKLTVFGLVATILTLLILSSKNKKQSPSFSKTIYIVSSIFIILSYVMFIAL